MKAKKYIFLMATVALVALNSCRDDNKIFDKSPSQRLEEARTELQKVLTSSPEGWEFVYFTDSANYGGYNMLMQFTDKAVTVQGGKIFPAGKYTSSYSIGFPQSLAITFDSYNEVFSLLGDPDDNSLTSTGNALGGENTLLWLRTSDNQDTIYFKSKNSNTRSQMLRHHGDWDTYINRINLMTEKFSGGNMDKYFREITLTNGNTLLFTGYDYLARTLSPLMLVNNNVSTSLNGVAPITEGFQFTKPVYINGQKITKIIYDDNADKFVVDASGIPGEMSSVEQPSFVFAGKDGQALNTMVFEPKVLYQLNGGSPELITALDSVLSKSYRILNDEYKIWDDFYGVMFYPVSSQDGTQSSHSLWLMFINKGDDIDSDEDDYLDVIAGVNSISSVITLDNSRTDKFSIKRPLFSRWTYRSYSDASKGHPDIFITNPEIKTYLTDAVNLLAASTSGSPYIIIPSSDYKRFTFGSTERNFYFNMRFVRKYE
jgi:hypothetical protein